MAGKPVAIIMGSDSDLPVVSEAVKVLKEMGVGSEVRVMSAHRTPKAVHDFVASAEKSGVKVFIAAAGGAAHLAGVVASLTTRPVIGIPIEGGSLGGLDALLSTVQMPAGVPVATVAVGKAGAVNAGILACQILALSDETLAAKLADYKTSMVKKVAEKDAKVRAEFGG